MQGSVWFMSMLTIASLGTFGCGSSRDVEVNGEIATPASAQGTIVVEFYENKDDEWSRVVSIELAQAGKFSEKVSLEGEKVRVRAFTDGDGNGACTNGEAWQEAESEISDDATASVSLTLAATPCPE